MRTHDISGTIGEAGGARPNTGGFAAQNHGQGGINQGGGQPPMQVGPPSGGLPRQQGPMSNPIPVAHQLPPQAHYATNVMPQQGPPPGQGNKKKPLLIAVGAFVVVVAAVVGIILATSNGKSDNTTATPGTGGKSTTSAGPTSGGGTAESGSMADCKSTTTQDDKGFTPCTRAIAGTMPDSGSCQKGLFVNSEDLGVPGTQSSTCELSDKHTVAYIQLASEQMAQSMVSGFTSSAGKDVEAVSWNGGGFTGKYYVIEFQGVGALLYTVDGQPLAGMVMNLDSTNTSQSTSLAEYFDQKIKPGS